MALRQPYCGFRPAFSASSRIVRFSASVQVAVVADLVKVMVAWPVSSMSTMVVVFKSLAMKIEEYMYQ